MIHLYMQIIIISDYCVMQNIFSLYIYISIYKNIYYKVSLHVIILVC